MIGGSLAFVISQHSFKLAADCLFKKYQLKVFTKGSCFMRVPKEYLIKSNVGWAKR